MTPIRLRGGRDLSWLGVKIRRRLTTPWKRAGIRLRDCLERTGNGHMAPFAGALPWLQSAAIPGWNLRMPWTVDAGRHAHASQLFLDAIAHRLEVLAAEPISVDAQTKARVELMRPGADELGSAIDDYHPIDWHRDFRSQHAWDPAEFYLDARVAPVAGADIKVPRELSRFQHIGALAGGPPDVGGREFLLQVLDWIVANPPRRGVNWECTMDVALRAVNWIWGLRLFEPTLLRYPRALREIAASIHKHGVHIENNLEYYEECTGNHYLSNIAGLLYIGAAFPQFPQSDRWLLFALQELVSEMHREVYADGGAHEASTHYHRLVAEVFVSCAALAERVSSERRARLEHVDLRSHRVRPRLRSAAHSGLNLGPQGSLLPGGFYARLASMAEFTVALTKPNGLVPQFGDNDSARIHRLLPHAYEDVRDHAHLPATIGVLLGREDLINAGLHARDEGLLVAGGLQGIITPPVASTSSSSGIAFFPDSGIAIARRGPAWLAVTCGANGQGGRGGHGHNDKLSFELNVHGLDFIVDGGCPVYSAAPEVRNRFRSTWAHSTIAVTKMEQDPLPSGVAGLFRLPERCKPGLRVSEDGAIEGSHIGYGAPHRRRLLLTESSLEIEDTLDVDADRWLIFNLDPEVQVGNLDSVDGGVHCTLVHSQGVSVVLSVEGAGGAIMAPGCFGLGYGIPVPTASIRMRLTRSTVRTTLVWRR